MTPQQLTAAADVIEQLNARDDLPLDDPIHPSFLRSEAQKLEGQSQ